MLSTKNLSGSKGLPKTLQPGNVTAKINNITLEKAYDDDSYNLVLHLESEELGPDFEGFLIDKDNPGAGRYKGQVGKVRSQRYAFTREINHEHVDRDGNILSALKTLAVALGKGEELDAISAPTIEAFVSIASITLSGDTLLNWCIAGKEYMKDGYTKYDLFLPKPTYKNAKKMIVRTELPYEAVNANPSFLMTFDEGKHIVKKKQDTVKGFEPVAGGFTPAVASDFEL